MWVGSLMFVEMEGLMKEILPEGTDTFIKQHVIHCLWFLF